MFESDDYDQILSQFELPETSTHSGVKTVIDTSNSTEKPHTKPSKVSIKASEQDFDVNNVINVNCEAVEEKNENKVSPKHAKRKIINSYFNHTSKRKFPGPAGLLNGSFKENEDDSVCLQEILSQDFELSQNCIPKDAFDSPLWKRLLEDLKSYKSGVIIDTIVGIKQQRTAGDIRWRKAGTLAAFVEAVDRSNTDPLITLRDITGSIKCTLHRDAWSKFSSYLVPECCALVLSKPTVLTMGSRAIKNHYLNITMSNILSIYSSVSQDDENEDLEGCEVKNVEDFTIIKLDRNNTDKSMIEIPTSDAQGLFDGLDSIFSDEIF